MRPNLLILLGCLKIAALFIDNQRSEYKLSDFLNY